MIKLTEIESRPHNIGFAIWRVKCYYETFVQDSTSVILLNFCAKMPPHRKAVNRCRQAKILTVEDYQLDKRLWTDADFDLMSWHDSLVYAFKVDQDLYFDIDYIFKWVQPVKDYWFSFWVAPCTLIFETPTKFGFDLESNDFCNYIEIADLGREVNDNGKTEWRIETHIGDIVIEADKFKQFVRRRPTLQAGQQIIPEERGEVSFTTAFDENFTETAQVKQIKHERFTLRKKATHSKHLQKELSDLLEKRLKGEVSTKQYIVKKRELEQQINDIKQELEKNDLEHLADSNF